MHTPKEFSCPVSIGELLDKISILRVKSARIKDSGKLAHVRFELERLIGELGDTAEYEPFIAELTTHNAVIWDAEEKLRAKERARVFDDEFLWLARTAFLTNDKRFEVKDRANRQFNSAIREQKSYELHDSQD